MDDIHQKVVFVRLAAKMNPRFASPQMHNRCVFSKYYSDDNFNVPSEVVSEFYNFQTVQSEFKALGVGYTPANKSDVVYKLKPVTEMEFLKCITRSGNADISPGIDYYPVMSWKPSLKSIKWVSKKLPPGEAVKSNMDDILRRTFPTGRDVFQHVRDKFVSMLAGVGIIDDLVDWSQCKALWDRGILGPDHFSTEDSFDLGELPRRKQPRILMSGGIRKESLLSPVARLIVSLDPTRWWRYAFQGETVSERFMDEVVYNRVDEEHITFSHVQDQRLIQCTMDLESKNIEVDRIETIQNPYREICAFQESAPIAGDFSSETLSEPVETHVVNPPEEKKPIDEDWRVHSIGELIKRPGLMFRGKEFTFTSQSIPMGTALIEGGGDRNTPGMLSWFSPMYAYYHGGFHMRIHGRVTPFVRYVPSNAAILSTFSDELNALVQPAMTAPWVAGRSDVGFVEFKLPCVTNRECLVVPSNTTDIQSLNYSAGKIEVYAEEDDPLSFVTIHAADNFQFRFFHRVPAISREVVVPPPFRGIEAKKESEEYGVSFADSEVPTVSDGGRSVLPIERDGGEEKQMTFQNVVQRYSFNASDSWTIAQNPGQIISSFRVPWDFAVNDIPSVPFTTFARFASRVKVKLTLQSGPFVQGSLAMVFIPGREPSELQDWTGVNNRLNLEMVPSVRVAAGATRDVDLEIPFVSPYSYLDTARSQESGHLMGTLALIVFNRIEVGPAAINTSAKWSIFASFPDAHFDTLDPQSLFSSAKDGGFKKISAHPESFLASLVPNVASVLKGAVDIQTKAIGEMKDMICDKPNDGSNAPNYVRKAYGDLATLRNVDRAQVLDALPDFIRNPKPSTFGTMDPEMELAYLRSKWSLLGTVRWDSTAVNGDILTVGDLTPCPQAFTTQFGTIYRPSILEYTCITHAFWTGSLEYRFEFVGSKFVNGRAIFCTHLMRQSQGMDFQAATSQYARTFDASSENRDFSVEVPYRAALPMLQTVLPPNVASGSVPWQDYTMGQWSLRVLNQLEVMESIASFVDVNVYIRAGPDFHTVFPGSGPSQFRIHRDVVL